MEFASVRMFVEGVAIILVVSFSFFFSFFDTGHAKAFYDVFFSFCAVRIGAVYRTHRTIGLCF